MPEEIWPELEAFSRGVRNCRVIESRRSERLVWESSGFLYFRHFEADLAPSELGCRFHLGQQVRGPLGWLVAFFFGRRWQEDMAAAARRLAGGVGRC